MNVLQEMEELTSAVMAGNSKRAADLLGRLWQRESSHAGKLLSERKYDLAVLNGLIACRMQKLSLAGIDPDALYEASLQRIYEAETIETCREMADHMVAEYCTLCLERKEKCYSPLVQKVMAEAEGNYIPNLTLSHFADSLNVNASYLSNLFRREIGMTITQYVITCRLEHAKKLLCSSDLPIKTIAKQVGIADVQYFSKRFKRETGMTPSQYRESH